MLILAVIAGSLSWDWVAVAGLGLGIATYLDNRREDVEKKRNAEIRKLELRIEVLETRQDSQGEAIARLGGMLGSNK